MFCGRYVAKTLNNTREFFSRRTDQVDLDSSNVNRCHVALMSLSEFSPWGAFFSE